MFKINEYFDGKVKSIAFESVDGPATVGVMDRGEYEFGTATKEVMTVVSGSMSIRLPDEDNWQTYGPGRSFTVDKDLKFGVRCDEQTAYLCLYR